MGEFVVSDAKELSAALKLAQAGDTVLLTGGDYGSVSISNRSFAGPVTIVSADPDHPAVFSYLMLNNVSNLTVRDVEVSIQSGRGLEVFRSDNIVLDNLNVHGPLLNPPSAGGGVYVNQSEHVTVSNSDIHHLANGLSHDGSSYVDIINNSFHDIRVDGVRGGGSSNVTIANNHFTDFYRQDGDHADAIQFWTTGTTRAAHDIVVINNVFERGAGDVAQGVFIRDESGKMPFENAVIQGNAVIGGMYNGIAVIGGKNVVISDNLVVGLSDMKSWIRIESATDVTLQNNVTSQIFTPNGKAGILETGTHIVDLISLDDANLLHGWVASNAGYLTSYSDDLMQALREPPITVFDPFLNGGMFGDGMDGGWLFF